MQLLSWKRLKCRSSQCLNWHARDDLEARMGRDGLLFAVSIWQPNNCHGLGMHKRSRFGRGDFQDVSSLQTCGTDCDPEIVGSAKGVHWQDRGEVRRAYELSGGVTPCHASSVYHGSSIVVSII